MTLAILIFAIGVVAGLRSMTAPAVVSWAAHLGWLNLSHSRLAWFGEFGVVIVLTFLALGELVADKLPSIPNRTSLAPLAGRIVTGAICGGALSVAAGQPLQLGSVLGAIGALAGAFGGYQLRHQLVTAAKLPGLSVALAEDLVAVVGGLIIVTRLR